MSWSTTSVTSQPYCRSRSRRLEQRLLVGQVERQVVELGRQRGGIPAGFSKVSDVGTVHSKKATVFSAPMSKK